MRSKFAKIVSMLRVLLLILLGFQIASSQVVHLAPSLHTAMESGDPIVALNELERSRAADADDFIAKDLDYLVAKMAMRRGDIALAMSSFQAVAARDSALRPYALKNLAENARSSGDLLIERLVLIEMIEFFPDDDIAHGAHWRLARNYFESANYQEAIRALTVSSVSSNSIDPIENRENRLLVAQSYLNLGQVENARQIFAELLDQTRDPDQPDDVALESVRHLDAMYGGELGKTAPQLTEAEHLRRGNAYKFNREFADARLHYDAIIAGYATGSAAPQAAFQIGRGYAQQANYVEALKWFERVIEQYPQSPAASDALLQAASAYARVVRPKESVTRYQQFIDKYPDDPRLDRAYLNIVDILRDQGNDTDALKQCAKVREVFKGKVPEAVALFAEARIYIAREEWQNALDTLDKLQGFKELGGSALPGGTSVEEITFLKALALETLKRYPEAIETYLSVPDGRDQYYGWRATERLRALRENVASSDALAIAISRATAALNVADQADRLKNARIILRASNDTWSIEKATAAIKSAAAASKTLPMPPASKQNLPTGVPLADRFISMSLYDEAALELEKTTKTIAQVPIQKRFAVLDALNRGGRSDLVMAFVEPLWRSVPANIPLEALHSEQLELLYPAPFSHDLVSTAGSYGVDPRLVLAIMRQESRFRPDAKSNAAARGLMQFISTTSNKIAGKLGRANFRQDELYFPPTAISFGSQYLADLYEAFPGQTEAVVASYNGGDDNMKRWFNRARSNLADRYVPEILFSQTKDYVQKTMASYRVYCYLYNEKLKPVRAG